MLDSALVLQSWLSPSFPVGAFAYSHGLEWAAEAGLVGDAKSCERWISDLLAHGSWRNDAILAAAAWNAAANNDLAALADIAELAAALAPSQERCLESLQQGKSFFAAVKNAWPHERLDYLEPAFSNHVPYAVTLGACANAHDIPLIQLLRSFGLGFTQNMISALIRLSVIGHTDGQRILASLLPLISSLSDELHHAGLDDLGSATLLSDICSLQHETQYTRFFRS